MVCNEWTEYCNKMTQEQIDNCVINGEGVGCLAKPLTSDQTPRAEVTCSDGLKAQPTYGLIKNVIDASESLIESYGKDY